MVKNIIYVLIILLLGLPSMAYEADELKTITIYERINPTIVSIDAQVSDGFSTGTGCIVRSDGLILTGSHVIDDSKEIEVKTHDGKSYKATVVAKMGKNNDLALLKINTKTPLKTVSFGNSANVKVGQKVLSIGNPFGFSGTLTQGIVSRIDYTRHRIQTDAAINPGCSGGPLLNSDGEVIGISQSIYNPDNNISNIGIGFAIPVDEAKKFIASNLYKK